MYWTRPWPTRWTASDYVTLVTCTPYGVNTHRLLVRGSRVPYTPGQEQAAAPSAALPGGRTTARYFVLGVAAGLLALLAALLLVWGVRRIRALRRAEGPADRPTGPRPPADPADPTCPERKRHE